MTACSGEVAVWFDAFGAFTASAFPFSRGPQLQHDHVFLKFRDGAQHLRMSRRVGSSLLTHERHTRLAKRAAPDRWQRVACSHQAEQKAGVGIGFGGRTLTMLGKKANTYAKRWTPKTCEWR
jgi:hypothetical protein